MPFFVAAFAAAQPAGGLLRVLSLVSIVAGAIAVTVGVIAGSQPVAVAGGATFIAGVGLVGAATPQPLRHALGPSRGLVARGYLVALVYVAIGATLATLLLAGWPPIADAWARIDGGASSVAGSRPSTPDRNTNPCATAAFAHGMRFPPYSIG